VPSINADEDDETTGLLNTVNDPDEEDRQEEHLRDKEGAASFTPRESQMSNRAKAAMKMGVGAMFNKKGDALKPDQNTKAALKQEAKE